MDGYVVVTDERNRRGRIPMVCGKENVECMDLAAFIEAEMSEE